MTIVKTLLYSRLGSLISKEFNQILRDRQLVSLLIVPSVVQLMLYGFALSPEVQHLRLAVVDLSNTPLSREITAGVVNNEVFDLKSGAGTIAKLGRQVAQGEIDLGMVIPPEAARLFKKQDVVPLQVLIDGVDANTAGIAQGYMTQTLLEVGKSLTGAIDVEPPVKVRVNFLYNPGLIASWFLVPGVMALVVVISGTLVSTVSVIREKDTGTLEQLLMTPSEPTEILAAKIIPLVILLLGSVLLSLGLALTVFSLPLRGSFLLFVIVSILAIFVAVSIGMSLATFSGNQRQALLTSFFINLPIIQLSGAIAPIESMPEFFRNLSYLDPLRYYVSSVRAILLRGVGMESIWPDVLALFAFAVFLLTLSALNFRKQLR
ncbi:MAG: ABC transporter permease [Candidatus Obscuribacterales bacterium]|nr:ABC transporter permease [Candidatus Obscuribacterales bacterium]